MARNTGMFLTEKFALLGLVSAREAELRDGRRLARLQLRRAVETGGMPLRKRLWGGGSCSAVERRGD